MKKLLYSSLLLVGLVASFQMDARLKSGDEALAQADTQSLIARISDIEKILESKNYDNARAYQLRDLANDAEAALYPEKVKQEALHSLQKTKKALHSKEFHANKLKVVAKKIDQMEKLS